MIYASIIFCVFFAALMYFLEKTLINPVTILFGLWAIIIWLSSLKLHGLIPASNHIYYLIFIGLLSFLIGYIIMRSIIFVLPTKKSNKIIVKKELKLRKSLIYFVTIVCILFYIKEFFIVAQYLLNGSSLAYIRSLAQDTDSAIYANKSGIENALKILIITPFTAALQPIVASNFILGDKDKKLISMNIIIICLRVLTDGSRTLVIYLAMSGVVTFLLSNKNNKLNIKKIKKYSIFTLIISCIIYAIYIITSSRSGDNINRFSYYYFSMQPTMFEQWASIVDSQNVFGYGMASLNGFAFAFLYILNNLFKIGYPEFWRTIYSLIEGTGTSWQTITFMGTQANSFVSGFWVLYLDGREFGIIIGMFIYGLIVAICFFYAKRYKNEKAVSLYSFICIGLFYTFVRLQFANIYYDLSLIFLLFFAYKSVYRKDVLE